MAEAPEDVGTPVCPGCLLTCRPASVYYCAKCGWDTGRYTPYIEFVNIRWFANGCGALWHKLWFDPAPSWPAKAGYFLVILFAAPIMLVGLPFVWLSKRRGSAARG
jgi:hypothetical protein